jgi:hypothetical protein
VYLAENGLEHASFDASFVLFNEHGEVKISKSEVREMGNSLSILTCAISWPGTLSSNCLIKQSTTEGARQSNDFDNAEIP